MQRSFSGLVGMNQPMPLARGAVVLKDVSVGYGGNPVLSKFSVDIAPGEFVYVVGSSGAGKSTLLKMLHGSLRPQSGTVMVDGLPVHKMHRWQTGTIRRRVGCVFQAYELLGHLTALENVLLPLQLAHPRIRNPRGYAMDALELVGLRDKMNELPGRLSGGQQQRVAVARGIAHQPRILLADEPTGNIDSPTSAEIMELFDELNSMGSTVIMATHDEWVLTRFPAPTIRLEPLAMSQAS
jgi:cell division transport system ATP-binding protein